jgi:hypothetical protein
LSGNPQSLLRNAASEIHARGEGEIERCLLARLTDEHEAFNRHRRKLLQNGAGPVMGGLARPALAALSLIEKRALAAGV